MTSPAPLGNPQHVIARARDARYRLREAARQISWGRVSTCGKPIGHGVALQSLSDGSAGFGGIETCSSVWSCPACSAAIGMSRRAELLQLVDWAQEEGLTCSFLTLTQRHHKGERLADTWKRLRDALKRLWSSRQWTAWAESVGVEGKVRAVEVTHGDSGWHVHVHLIIITRAKFFGAANDFLGDLWASTLAKVGGSCEPRIGCRFLGVKGGTEDVVANYLGKLGSDIGFEMAMGLHKKGRKSNRTPFQILADAVENGDADDVELWHEWLKASQGQRSLVWSRGLKDRVGINDVSDAEAMEQGTERETLGYISRQDYEDVLRSGLIGELLSAVETSSDIGQIIGVGGLRIRVWESIDDVPKVKPRTRKKQKKPVWVEREELAWSNQPLW